MPVVVFSSSHPPEAEILAGLLRSYGFHPRVHGADTARMVGMGSHLAPTTVLVPPSEADDALEVLEHVVRYDQYGRLSFIEPKGEEGRLTNSGPAEEPKHCPACHEVWEPGFEICWNCETELS